MLYSCTHMATAGVKGLINGHAMYDSVYNVRTGLLVIISLIQTYHSRSVSASYTDVKAMFPGNQWVAWK